MNVGRRCPTGVIAKVTTWRRRLRRPEIKGRSNWPAQAQMPRLQVIQYYSDNFRNDTPVLLSHFITFYLHTQVTRYETLRRVLRGLPRA